MLLMDDYYLGARAALRLALATRCTIGVAGAPWEVSKVFEDIAQAAGGIGPDVQVRPGEVRLGNGSRFIRLGDAQAWRGHDLIAWTGRLPLDFDHSDALPSVAFWEAR